MVNIAICDDNIIFMNHFKSIVESCLSKYTGDFQITTVSNGNLLLAKNTESEFDVVFLDIDMPDISGFDVAKTLRDNFSRCFLIFITNHAELVYESMDFQPFNFIRKNCGITVEESIEKIISKLIHHIKQYEKIMLEDDISGRIAVYIKDIVFIESDKHYVLYHVTGKEFPIRMRDNIGNLEVKYASYDFVRIHKRYLINFRFLSNIDGKRNEVALGALHTNLPLSKNYKKVVDEKYTLFLRSMI
ncbi:MAG: LytTR family DNA-binding domain-containing protein [Oscillospiraceae bacterium]|nr:LytTR family DNA-binding domain-containing protein [Oscillospiraceae bacterium]